jgi:hypothetical protein
LLRETPCEGKPIAIVLFNYKQAEKNGDFPRHKIWMENGHLIQTSAGVPGSERSVWVTV